jgi:1-deoxy-D-xylulose-5-phosphate synthase
LTVEENIGAGGFGSAVLELLSDHGLHGIPVKRLAVGDLFVEHGSQKILRRKYGLDSQGILEHALALLGHPNGKKNVVFGNF